MSIRLKRAYDRLAWLSPGVETLTQMRFPERVTTYRSKLGIPPDATTRLRVPAAEPPASALVPSTSRA